MLKSAIRLTTLSVVVLICFNSQSPCSAQGRNERKVAAAEESAKPKAVAGGVTFQRNAEYDKTFEDLVNFLKKQGYEIDAADKHAGNIFTTMAITGKWKQTGTRVTVTLIKDSNTATSVRVAVTEQKRYKAAQTEPWGEPKVNSQKSSEIANLIKSGLS
jgi:hypothetical protein